MTYVGKPTLSREFGRLDSRLSAVERQATATGATLPVAEFEVNATRHNWLAAGAISTLNLAHPTIRIDFRVGVRAGFRGHYRLFDADAGRPVSDQWTVDGVEGAALRWATVEWMPPRSLYGIGVWNRVTLQHLQESPEDAGGVSTRIGMATAMPLSSLPNATPGGVWGLTPPPPGYNTPLREETFPAINFER
ncbi:hypothetical protein [Kitasatospora sp. McL0602]|uniref:hypothetical protein n=1 Tax=Kitasatospora sp. McL0602 TaxID=3439530 RepID=UPI003F8A2252